MVNVSGPKTYSLTEYGTSYSFGAWGRDANPAPGDENKYWLVVLSSSNAYGNFIRQYNSLSTIILGIGSKDTYISSSNPTTNTIQGQTWSCMPMLSTITVTTHITSVSST